MDEMMQFGRRIPEYYPSMYLDGYTPYEILHATRRKMYQEYQEREEAKRRAKEEKEQEAIPVFTIKSVVKIK